MQQMIQQLLEKGFAYTTPTAVYFDISKAQDYTRLSGQKLELNQQGAGHGTVDDLTNKHNSEDFALWLFKTGEHEQALQVWTSPFISPLVIEGLGLPGWHIECSAMSKSLLGNTIDIHMGGVEHIPVHHTNEIAQSESANGEAFVNYWLHNEHLLIDSRKMAKSEGTAYYMSDISEQVPALALRYFFLQSHYRSKQNFTWEALQAAANGLKRMQELVFNLAFKVESGYNPLPAGANASYTYDFKIALEDDFNLPQALAVSWNMLQDLTLSPEVKISTITRFDQVLGLKLLDKVENPDSTPDIQITIELEALLTERQAARANKDWAKSDKIRDQIKQQFGYTLVDSANSQSLTK